MLHDDTPAFELRLYLSAYGATKMSLSYANYLLKRENCLKEFRTFLFAAYSVVCNYIFFLFLKGFKIHDAIISFVSGGHTKQTVPALLSHGVHFTVG